MKRFIYLLLTTIFVFSIIIISSNNVAYAQSFKIDNFGYDDIEYLQSQIEETMALMNAAHNMAEAARTLGYEESHDVIQLAQEEYDVYKIEKDNYQFIYDTLISKWEAKRAEYPEATRIWENLKQAGYSDYVCAGIVGNIMTEVGGNTLVIQPLLYSDKYYGMCQWSSYYPGVWGLSVDEQCDFLLGTIEYEINACGKLYQRDMNYEKFLNMTDCRQVALCFAKSYERCSSAGYYNRQENAVVAYNYFVS